MAGIITLEDGSDIYASNIGLSGAFERIADSISDIDAKLSRWLLDMAQRPGGCMDFDLGGLSDTSRNVFWIGVKRANDSVLDWDQEISFSHSVEVIRVFYERCATLGPLSNEHSPQINLDDLWFKSGRS